MPIPEDSPRHYIRYRLEILILELLSQYKLSTSDARCILDNCITTYKDNLANKDI